MSSQQPSDDSKTLIKDSQQRHEASKTITISMSKTCKCVSPQPSGDSKTLIMHSQQRHEASKTITISMEKRANGFTAAFWIFQNINNGFTTAS